MGPRAKERIILHVDMDAFFAAIEVRRHPELKGLPVVVGGRGDPTERGVVSTASYEARKYGIHSAMPLRLAWRRCPSAVFLPVDLRTYSRVSKEVLAILHRFSRHVQGGGLDEAFLDVSHSQLEPEALAEAIRAAIRDELQLPCSVGIGPNKLLAKLASDLAKPDGVTRLRYQDIPERVWPLPVGALLGVGPRTQARLRQMKVFTIGDLAAIPAELLVAAFGNAHGTDLYKAAHGVDESPVTGRHPVKSIGRQQTFQDDVTDRTVLEGLLEGLAEEVAGRLRRYHYRARSVTVKVRYSDFETLTRAVTLPESTDERQRLLEAAHRALRRFDLAKPVRLLGVSLGKLDRHREPRAPD